MKLSDHPSFGKKPETKKRQRSSTPAPAAPAVPDMELRPFDCYYWADKDTYWTLNQNGDWQATKESHLKRRLRLQVYQDVFSKPIQDNLIDRHLLQIQFANSVDWAGPVGGFRRGILKIRDTRVLIISERKEIKPKQGPWTNIKNYIEDLLGEQSRIWYAWMKAAIDSLNAGYPWRPGQMLIVAGNEGCGKSLMQSIVTDILGERAGDPFKFLMGLTQYNNTVIGKEHLLMGESLHAGDIKARRMFAAAVKSLLVNEFQTVSQKFKDEIIVYPFNRCTLTVNDEDENLLVIPPLDKSIKNKIILLRAHKVNFPVDMNDLDQRRKFRQTLTEEVPAFLAAMKRWKIPDDLKDGRYGCKAFHDPHLVGVLQGLQPEVRLLRFIDTLGIWEMGQRVWKGSSHALETILFEKDSSGRVAKMLYFENAIGTYLARVMELHPERVQRVKDSEGRHVWHIASSDNPFPIE